MSPDWSLYVSAVFAAVSIALCVDYFAARACQEVVSVIRAWRERARFRRWRRSFPAPPPPPLVPTLPEARSYRAALLAPPRCAPPSLRARLTARARAFLGL